MGGMFVGNVFGSMLSDWYGRRSSYLASLTMGAIGQIISAASMNPYMYAVSRFLCGVSFACKPGLCLALSVVDELYDARFLLLGYMGGVSIYSIEFLPTKWRHLSGSIGPFAEGTMILGLLAYLFRPWRTLAWVTVAPFVVLIFVFP